MELKENMMQEEDTPRWKEEGRIIRRSPGTEKKRKEAKASKSILIDNETKEYLEYRLEQIESQLPSLKSQYEEIENKLSELNYNKNLIKTRIASNDQKISKVQQQLLECDRNIQKNELKSPTKGPTMLN